MDEPTDDKKIISMNEVNVGLKKLMIELINIWSNEWMEEKIDEHIIEWTNYWMNK